MAKAYKIYITIRKDKEHKVIGWFIVDKKSPVDYKFKTKREALDYVRKNYQDVTVMVQNEVAKFQYTLVLENKKVVSFTSKADENSTDRKTTTKDIQGVFKYKEEATSSKKPKVYKIYITIRKDKEHNVIGWFIVDKKSPVDYKFKTKREALDYVRDNYENVTVLVQNDDAKFQYTLVLENKKVISFTSRTQGTEDYVTTTKDVEESFKYTIEEVEAIIRDNETSPVWMGIIMTTLVVAIIMSLVAIIITVV